MVTTQPRPAIAARNICIAFDGVPILKKVNFTLQAGEVHGVAGSNGAGKSTLMKILNGVYAYDSGQLRVFGRSVRFTSPQMARRAGIAMVYQDLSLIPTMTVAQNIFLHQAPYRRGPLIDDRRCNQKALELLASVGVEADTSPQARVEEISSGQKQIVEIVKALAHDPKILILDEPTASLTQTEIERLFAVVRRLKQRGISIVYITHYLRDIFAICDAITVLRDGETVFVQKTQATTVSRVVDELVGQATESFQWPRRDGLRTGTPLLSVDRLTTERVHEVSLDVYRGEIVGIAGLLGSGRSELLNALYGVDRIIGGAVRLNGRTQRNRSTGDAIAGGISLVPENRREQGLITDFTVSDNVVLSIIAQLARRLFIDESKVLSIVTGCIASLGIKTQGPGQTVRLLSGGNQQKIVVAKCLAGGARILLLDDPTFGVDIHAKHEIMKIIREYVDRGNGAIFVSSEFKEIASFCDATYIMKWGGITDFIADRVTEDDLVHAVQ